MAATGKPLLPQLPQQASLNKQASTSCFLLLSNAERVANHWASKFPIINL
jgi:hypothetical protein